MARPQADDLPVVLVVDDQREKFDRLVAAASRFADGRLLRQFRFEFTGCFEELKEWYRRHRGTFVSLIVQDIDFATTEERKLVGFLGGVRPAGTVIDIRALQGLLIYSHLRHLGIDRVVPVLFTVGSAGHTQVQELTQFIMYPGFGSCSFIEEGAVDSAAGLEALLAAVDVHALRPLDSQQRGHWRNYHHMVIGRSRKMARLTHEIERIGPTDGIVLILGGPGVGKELVANALHRTSYRFSATDPGRQFPLTVNMGALDRNLVWDDLFGHESGAYTGATGERAGIFEAARGSTVFLDEIGEIDHELQVKLLRII
ncbi:MAG: sigma 54-interacting transcriptional regulator, partial [candidate division WOR-3 bacterium]